MNDANDKPVEFVDGIPVASEQIGFRPNELIVCGKCAKSNPPNRLQCFYCGETLDLPAEIADGLLIKPEEIDPLQNGINIVLIPKGRNTETAEIVKAVAIDEGLIEFALRHDSPMPIARVGEKPDAMRIHDRFSSLGIATKLVPDIELKSETPPKRIRSLAFEKDSISFISFNSNERFDISCSRIEAIIVGSIVETRWDATVKKSRKETKNLDESSTTSDFGVIDLHIAGDSIGYRITAHGFDFSCLGENKSLLAVENFRKLIAVIREAAPAAVFDDTYASKQKFLDLVWEPTRRNESKGVQRAGFGLAVSKGESTSNAVQFTKYSRLRKFLI